MLDPKPDLYTLINVCAGAYRDEPAFAEKILDAYCTCVAARGGNTDRLRALFECGKLTTPREAAGRIQEHAELLMELASARADAWRHVLAGIDGIDPLDHLVLSLIWEIRMWCFRMKEHDHGGTLAVPAPSRRHTVLRDAYLASGRAARRMHAAAATHLAVLDARIFEVLTSLPVVITETKDGQELVVSPIPEADLLAAGFPTDDERHAWWDRNGP